MDMILAVLGLAILLFAGDMLVRGAVALSVRLGVPSLIIGLTVVSFGTSAPELIISVQAALEGVPGIAIGNVVGSNIANVLMVLGLPALVVALDPSGCKCNMIYFQMLAASVILIGLCFTGPLHFWQAGVLLGLFALMLADAVRAGRDGGPDLADEIEDTSSVSGPLMAGYLAAGVAGLPVGAQLLISGAVGISQSFGISEEVIGLSMVAIGTSLPELATTFMAAIRRQADVAFGNVIGSNLFNILAILGIASLFGPIPVGSDFLTRDLWVMIACSLLLAPFVLGGRKLTKRWGILFLTIYAVYTYWLFHNGGSAA